MFIVHPQNKFSKGARLLAKALKGRRSWQRPPTSSDTIINWGDGECPYPNGLNSPAAVRLASNKLRAFDVLAASTLDVPIPRYAREKAGVTWKGLTVVRHKLTGHSGEGIEIVEEGEELPNAPLYVQYIKKEQEFRIHVGKRNGETQVIAVQRKARDKAVPSGSVNWQVRNHVNGFVFVRGDANPSPATITAACNALVAIGLDFGAVDLVFNAKDQCPYVLEVNTAPGLEGQTIEDYANFFKSLV